MAKDIGIKDGQFIIENGDFKAVEADKTHIERILVSNKGDWKNSPLTGVGLYKWTNAPSSGMSLERLARTIELQLRFDGFTPIKVDVSNLNNIIVNAERA